MPAWQWRRFLIGAQLVALLSARDVAPNQISWINIRDVFTVPFGMIVDPLSRTMLVVVNTIRPGLHLLDWLHGS